MKTSIIKLGGSIITDKNSQGNFNRKTTLKLAKELYPYFKGCVIIHGTGQVGKPPAIKYGYVKTGLINDNLLALKIKSSIRQLNHQVVSTLLSVSIPAIPMDVLHFFDESNNFKDPLKLKSTLINIINNGIVPVFFGDLIPMKDGSFKVISSDLITLKLAELINPNNVFFLTNVNGVYSDKLNEEYCSEIIPNLSFENINAMQNSKDDQDDVSGGMQKKAKIALETTAFCKRCFIGNGQSDQILRNLFTGNKVKGTFVSG